MTVGDIAAEPVNHDRLKWHNRATTGVLRPFLPITVRVAEGEARNGQP
ncbi:hypothetical protein EV378_3542 [Pseudonocardia endophytica]|uniref:Uncharacterized protein n=1 Tax=Pseudonocardia endophytica TaxID=401976 RepID=A0A4R1HXY1_PSEEN|nr:hypothetical protein EV378_3542 [Pseudonocardia endophytica]